MKWLNIILIFSLAMTLHHVNKDDSTGTEPKRTEVQGDGSPVKYSYTVSDKARGYISGVETKTFKDYQKAVGVKQDGKAGFDTCTATNFYNAQERMFK